MSLSRAESSEKSPVCRPMLNDRHAAILALWPRATALQPRVLTREEAGPARSVERVPPALSPAPLRGVTDSAVNLLWIAQSIRFLVQP